MAVPFKKLSIASVVLALLAGCSYKGVTPADFAGDIQQSETESKVLQASELDVCAPETGSPFHLRKAILIAGTTSVPDLARDLPGLAKLTSRRLQTHLDNLNRFNVFATHNSTVNTVRSGTAVRVRQMSRESASQFVVKIELEDLTLYTAGGLLARLSGKRYKRNILLKLNIFDTENGALFYSQEYHRTVNGDVVGYPGNGKTVSIPWFDTELGKQVDEILEAMSFEINEKLACVPFSTEVTAVKGNEVFIGAGYMHGIRPGETLRVYRRNNALASEDAGGEQTDEGWIKISSVFQNYSVANITDNVSGETGLETGDVLRAW